MRLSDEEIHRRWTLYHQNGGNATQAGRILGLAPSTSRQFFTTTDDPTGFEPAVSPEDDRGLIAQSRPKIHITVSQNPHASEGRFRVMAIGDAHDSPSIRDKRRFLWMGRHAEATAPDSIVQIGDFLSMDSLCRYEGNETLRGRDKPSFQQDMDSAHLALSEFDRGMNGFKCPKHVTLGNHEDRALSFTDRNPEMAGMLTGQIDNLFMSHRWTYSPYGLIHFIGGVGFTHVPLNGMGKPYGGVTAKNRIAADCLHDLVYGHDHKGGYEARPKIGTNQSVKVLNVACALPDGHVERYVGHGQSGWNYGIYDLLIDKGKMQSWQFISMAELEERYD